MMECTLGELDAAASVLFKLKTQSEENQLSFSTSIKLLKIISQITPELKEFESYKKSLLEKYGKEIYETVPETGEQRFTNTYEILPETKDKFLQNFDKLISIKRELPNCFPFEYSDLEQSKLSPTDIQNLGPFYANNTEEQTTERTPIEFEIEE